MFLLQDLKERVYWFQPASYTPKQPCLLFPVTTVLERMVLMGSSLCILSVIEFTPLGLYQNVWTIATLPGSPVALGVEEDHS